MLFGRVLAGTVIAEIVLIHAIHDVLVAALAAHLLGAGGAILLAVETAIGIVGDVIGIVEFARLNVLVRDAELFNESLGVTFVRLGDGGGVRGDGESIRAHGAMGGPGEIGGVRASGKCHDQPVHAA